MSNTDYTRTFLDLPYVKEEVISLYKKDLIKLGVDRIDYLEIINKKILRRPTKKNKSFNIFIAYHLNKVRLIDNI